MPEKPPARLRLEHVDGLRAVAALVVFLNHAYAQIWETWPVARPVGALAFTRYAMIAGHLSVTVFIVLSGFCLMLPAVDHGLELRGGVKGFLRRRALRILPPYYAALVLCLILIATVIGKPTGTLWDVPIQTRPLDVVSHVLLLQDVFGTARINYVFWSIAVEWQIYFFMPLLVWAWRRKGALAVVLSALALGYALRFGFDGSRVARMHPQYLGMFALGALSAVLVRSTDASFARLRERFPFGVTAGLAFAGVVWLTVKWDVPLAEARMHWLDLPVGVMAAALLVSTSRSPSSPLRLVLSWRPLVFVGTFSYSLYLIHAPVLQLCWQYWLNPLGVGRDTLYAYILTGGFAAVLVAAYAFHRAFEAPFMVGARRSAGVPSAA